MAQHQGSSTSTPSTGGTQSRGLSGQGSTGVQDSTYNVISVVYHTLQGAETVQRYMQDMQGADPQVEQFLREAQEAYKRLGQRGRECLAQVLQQQGGSGQQMQGGTSGGQMGQGRGGNQQSQGGGSTGNFGGGSGQTR